MMSIASLGHICVVFFVRLEDLVYYKASLLLAFQESFQSPELNHIYSVRLEGGGEGGGSKKK